MKRYMKIFLILNLCLTLTNSMVNSLSSQKRMKSWEFHEKLRVNSPFNKLKWRAVGPAFAGGRIETITCPPGNTGTIYVGAGSGNLWKSINNGTTWKPIFENESTFAIASVAVSPSAPDVVWVGTGEVLMARSSFAGTGVFKSTDGGNTWKNMGLNDTYHIARVLIDPQDQNIVYVAAIGHNYTYNQERGLFKTSNGGKTWEKILYISDKVGCIEVVIDPADHRTLYAVMWERDRKAWNHTNTGINSGIYKSSDAGRNWKLLKGGFPKGENIGRIGIAISPSNPGVIYALVDNHDPRPDSKRHIGGEVFRSHDHGETWTKTHKDYLQTVVGYDFCLIRVSPDDENQIYILGNYLLHSFDGGKTFNRNQGKIVNIRPHNAEVLHLDHHDLWIDPLSPDRLLLGTDGGLYTSYDRGQSWLRMNNLPVTEVYAVTLDMAVPYNIYIGTQDNAALFGPGTYTLEDMGEEPWKHVYLDRWGGGDSYFTRIAPDDPNTIYYEHQFGELLRKNMKDGTKVKIKPKPQPGESLRCNWMTPFIISRTNPAILYYGANKVFKSIDRGNTWKCISPDLTTNPGKDKQGNVPYGTITTLSESPLQPGLIYIGTDDGNIQVTKDDGKTWEKVNRDLPDRWVSRVAASGFDLDTVYVSFTGYREDDFSPYLFKSGDNGKTWESISAGLPKEPINVIREDHRDKDILYVGTDLGIYITIDGGLKWYSLCNNLPTTPVHDIALHPRDNELVIGTHGRGVFILDARGFPGYKSQMEREKRVRPQTKRFQKKKGPTSVEDRQKSWQLHQELKIQSPFKHLKWDPMGPAKQGGRISSVACSTGVPTAIYLGVGSGNVWKSINNGITWQPVFEHESTFAVGDIAVSSSNKNIVWVGTGEEYIGRNSYSGTGIFKSTDAGKTWENMGLQDSHHISKIVIDANNPDVVYAAALGHQYSSNRQKGLFKTRDGGKTWEKILYISGKVGVIDVVIDPSDSQTLYAAAWENSGRTPWSFTSCGPGSGVYKTTNGGKTWKRLKKGLPTHQWVGRIGLGISPANPRVIYLLMDNQAARPGNNSRVIGAEVYRSENKGAKFKKVNKKYLDGLFNSYGYYFGDIRVSPDNENNIYVLGFTLFQSKDGGKTYQQLGDRGSTIIHLNPHQGKVLHADNHDLWIDPLNPHHLLLANDGGFFQSYDEGLSWLHINTLPISEIYALSYDFSQPFNIYCGTQDNASLKGPGNYIHKEVSKDPWIHLWLDRWAGGDGYFTFVDPRDPDIVYYENQFGGLRRKNLSTGVSKYIRPGSRKDELPLRYNWMAPFLISHHQESTLYFGANKVFKSIDKGDHWRCISPDLTGNPGSEKWGNFPEAPRGRFYGTISSISESLLEKGLIIVGTDDGYVQVTEDDGINWRDISRELPRQWVSRVVASRHEPGTVYVSMTGYREDNFEKYLYMSTNLGSDWQAISGNLPSESINVIREDPKNKNILYVGTDMGVYVTLNRGKKWYSLCGNLPTTPVHDLVVHPRENKMIIGTHGRGCYILDITPIHQMLALPGEKL